MELRVPKLKRCKGDRPISYPTSLRNVMKLRALGCTPQGKYNGNNVTVDNIRDMNEIYNLGFFGKGSLSRAVPDYQKRRELKLCRTISTSHQYNTNVSRLGEQLIKQNNVLCGGQKDNIKDDIKSTAKHLENREDNECKEKVDMENYSNEENVSEGTASTSAELNIEKHFTQSGTVDSSCDMLQSEDCCASADSFSGNILESDTHKKSNNINEASSNEFQESLHLNLEEAYFLAYGLGCLKILDLFGRELSLQETWELFCESQDDFIQKYVAYHYFRAKGWVVKPGIKFGGDFLLYKFGPQYAHATYIVVIEVVTEKGCINEEHNQQQKWIKLIGLNRLAESSGKDVLLCRVVWPHNLLLKGAHSPNIVKKFTVEEVTLKRWVSSQEREQLDQEEMGE